MPTAFADVRPAALKVKTQLRFPASIQGAGSIVVSTANGKVTIDEDYTKLAPYVGTPDADSQFKTYNPKFGYQVVPYGQMIAGVADYATAAQNSANASAAALAAAQAIAAPIIPQTILGNLTSGTRTALAYYSTPYAIDANGFGSLTDAIAAIGSNIATLVISRNFLLTQGTVFPRNVSLVIVPGGRITKTGANTMIIRGPFAAPNAQVFFGFNPGDVTFSDDATDRCMAEWWGADPTGAADSAPAIRNQLKASPNIWRNGKYLMNSTASFEDGRNYMLTGKATYFTNSAIILFQYVRVGLATNVTFRDTIFQSYNAGAIAVSMTGKDGGGPCRCSFIDGEVHGFLRGFDMTIMTGYYSDIFSTFNSALFFAGRDFSFVDMNDIWNSAGDYSVYAKDPIGGGISNAVAMYNFKSIAMKQCHFYFSKYDFVTFYGGSADLGDQMLGPQEAVFDQCSNVKIYGMYFSSWMNRTAIYFLNSPSFHVDGCSFNNCGTGIAVAGSINKGLWTISDNKFEGFVFYLDKTDPLFPAGKVAIWSPGKPTTDIVFKGTNHIIVTHPLGGGDIHHNTLDDTPFQLSRTGSDYELFIAGVPKLDVSCNRFLGTRYPMGPGAGSSVNLNSFSDYPAALGY